MIKIKKGLDLPISGAPSQTISEGNKVTQVAILGDDYVGMKPTMKVQEGDQVACGQVIFTDKKTPGVVFTSPASGKVVAINRGSKRKLLSVVIEISGDEQVEFAKFSDKELGFLGRDQVRDNLVNSGLWTSFRTRPFSKTPEVDAVPDAIFVTAMDTHPLSPDPAVVLQEHAESFNQGLQIIAQLTEGKVFVCSEASASIEVKEHSQVVQKSFSGVHPAGLPGTHIHFLHGATVANPVWHIGYQDVVAIGKLFTTGKLFTDRIIAIGGPSAKNPRLVRTRLGCNLKELLANEVHEGDVRKISGSVFGGFAATGARSFLGKFHNQVTVLPEGREKELFGWLVPGANKFSVTRAFLSSLIPGKKFDFTTTTGGSERALMPIGSYERIMPLDILSTQLLRALVSKDTDTAQQLGCLELDEEDLALATFVCPGKFEFGPILREALTTIEREG